MLPANHHLQRMYNIVRQWKREGDTMNQIYHKMLERYPLLPIEQIYTIVRTALTSPVTPPRHHPPRRAF